MTRNQEYYEYINSPCWMLKTEEVCLRNQGLCECCNMRYSTVAHHRSYDRLGEEKDEDLIALCQPCHKGVHGEISVVWIFESNVELFKKLVNEVLLMGVHYGEPARIRRC